MNGGANDVAHLTIRAVRDCCQARRTSCAFAFLDLAAAFATVIRRLAICTSVSDQELMSRLSSLGFNVSEKVEIFNELNKLDVWGKSLTPADVQATLRQFLSHTWVSFEHISGVLAYTSGATAGTPLSDIIVAVSFVTVL